MSHCKANMLTGQNILRTILTCWRSIISDLFGEVLMRVNNLCNTSRRVRTCHRMAYNSYILSYSSQDFELINIFFTFLRNFQILLIYAKNKIKKRKIKK